MMMLIMRYANVENADLNLLLGLQALIEDRSVGAAGLAVFRVAKDSDVMRKVVYYSEHAGDVKVTNFVKNFFVCVALGKFSDAQIQRD